LVDPAGEDPVGRPEVDRQVRDGGRVGLDEVDGRTRRKLGALEQPLPGDVESAGRRGSPESAGKGERQGESERASSERRDTHSHPWKAPTVGSLQIDLRPGRSRRQAIPGGITLYRPTTK